jgi:hypothetical protein
MRNEVGLGTVWMTITKGVEHETLNLDDMKYLESAMNAEKKSVFCPGFQLCTFGTGLKQEYSLLLSHSRPYEKRISVPCLDTWVEFRFLI